MRQSALYRANHKHGTPARAPHPIPAYDDATTNDSDRCHKEEVFWLVPEKTTGNSVIGIDRELQLNRMEEHADSLNPVEKDHAARIGLVRAEGEFGAIHHPHHGASERDQAVRGKTASVVPTELVLTTLMVDAAGSLDRRDLLSVSGK
jgi:hypothetical protein